jgi:anaerobic ribonucleoside-triphosphate reductase activating protein
MNYHKIEKTSIANGEGIRVVLWVSGCSLHCRGCHNPETWGINSGKKFDDAAKKELFEALDKPYIQGITFSGGHPFEKENVETVYLLIKEIKEKFPHKDIWLYTGYTWNQIFYPVVTDDFNPERDRIINLRKQIVEMCDVIVDGRYIDYLRDITLKWRGSNNQRVIDVKKTIEENKIVLYN